MFCCQTVVGGLQSITINIDLCMVAMLGDINKRS